MFTLDVGHQLQLISKLMLDLDLEDDFLHCPQTFAEKQFTERDLNSHLQP